MGRGGGRGRAGVQSGGQVGKLFEGHGFGADLGGEIELAEQGGETRLGSIRFQQFEHHFAALGEGPLDDADKRIP